MLKIFYRQVDPERNWSEIDIDDSNRYGEIAHYLRSSNFSIKISTINQLHLLFSCKNGNNLSGKLQDERFKVLYQVALETLNVNAREVILLLVNSLKL